MMKKKLIVFGAGENSTVVDELAVCLKYSISKYIDPIAEDRINIIESLERLESPNEYVYAISIGNNEIREKVFIESQKVISSRLFVTLIHPSAVISSSSDVGLGSLVMANVFIGPRSNIGRFTFINTGAQLDHHNQVGDFVHVAPGVVTGGRVSIGSRSFIGMAATISDHCTIGERCSVGAMSFVSSNVSANERVFGIPAISRQKN